MLARTAAVGHTFICEFVYVLIFIVKMIFFRGSFRPPVHDGVYVARNFCWCPTCTSSTDESVRKCHETLSGIGLLESHSSQRHLLYGETLCYVHTRYKDSRERSKSVFDPVLDM